MAGIAVTGGAGSGTIATTASSTENETVFTTPSTTNALFRVRIWLWGGAGLTSHALLGKESAGLRRTLFSDAGTPKVLYEGLYGPNVAVTVPIQNHDDAEATTNFAYDYVGMVFS